MSGLARVLPAAWVERTQMRRTADALAAAVAASLPWSTSATGILVALWIVALLPTLDGPALRRALCGVAEALPALLVALAAIGMLWSDVSFAARVEGLAAFAKLLAIPLLIAQFRRSDNGMWPVTAFAASAGLLCLASWLNVVAPPLPWTPKMPGIPVKDYISQSGIFTLCAFGFLCVALDRWREAPPVAFAALAAALLFLADIVYVATGRTAVAVIPILFVLLGLRRLRLRPLAVFLLGGVLIAALAWSTSPYLRTRVINVGIEIDKYRVEHADTSSGERLEFWKRSLAIIGEAPVIGHGTGTIADNFRRLALARSEAGESATNPHNQIFAVAMQLGASGAILLIAMWAAHGRMFWAPGLAGWLGLAVVTQNIVSSLFNSHLFDFTQGWIYVFGVGVLGGMVLRKQAPDSADAPARDLVALR
jgi:O-antigen ligase